MSWLKFEASDFHSKGFIQELLGGHKIVECFEAANIANAKLREWLEQAPVVNVENETEIGFGWSGIQNIVGGEHRDNYTHTARLVDIRQLSAKEDTAESLLREQINKNHPVYCDIDWIKRAKNLLDGGGKK